MYTYVYMYCYNIYSALSTIDKSNLILIVPEIFRIMNITVNSVDKSSGS